MRVGAGSVVSAGSLIIANTVIPPGSLVLGVPARVVRPVGERELELIEDGWTSYVALTRTHLCNAGRLPADME